MSDAEREQPPDVGTATTHRARPAAERTSRFSAPARRFTPELFRRRRERLFEAIGGGVAVLFGAKSALDGWEERRFDPAFRIDRFRQEPNLFYLTGLEVPGAAVVLDGDSGELQAFVPDMSDGVRKELDRLGLGDPSPLETFDERVGRRVRDRPVYLVVRSPEVASLRAGFGEESGFPRPLPGGEPHTFPDEQLAARFERRYRPAEVHSLVPPLLELRRSKDSAEVDALRAAARATVAAFRVAIPEMAPGVEPLEIGAELQAGARGEGAQRDAFTPVVQAGTDGLLSFVDVIDAYDGLNRTLEAGELAMLDYGAELDYYVADLARTVPVSGRFTSEQRIAYEAYLFAYRAGLGAVGPGRPFMDAARATARAFGNLAPELPGWLRAAAEDFADRGGELRPGHFLGLEMHDHEGYHAPLRSGEVLAYEHHFRIPDRGWRITVEDMLLVTEGGCEVLTAGLPSDPDGIETLMQGGEGG